LIISFLFYRLIIKEKELSELKGDMKEMKARMVSMEKRIERIESDVRDIKNLLYKIIDLSQNRQQKKE
jgi:hypothetical protein